MRTDAGLIEVVPVEGARLERAFVELPYSIYRDDPLWVPPLRWEERRRWRSSANPSLGRRRVRRFLALRDGRPVGRVAAILDPDFANRWEPGTGLFGFYECADDGAATGLLAAAECALREAGARAVIGPVNLTFHDETGLLVEGFDSPPMLLSPYNPPGYASQLERADYRPAQEYLSYRWTPAMPCRPAVERLLRSARAGHGPARGVRVRPLDPSRWNEESDLAWRLYSESFAGVWGNTPMTREEFAHQSDRFRQFLVPELALFAERDGVPVGFALTLPDLNQAIRAANGRLLPLGWLRLCRAAAKVRTARCAILGVRPEETGRGIAGLLAWETARAAERLGYELLELSLVLTDNARVKHVVDAFGGVPWKKYRLYRKEITEGRADSETANAGESESRGWARTLGPERLAAIRMLERVDPARHLPILAFPALWMGCALLMLGAGTWWLRIVPMILIGFAIHALGIVMHEGIHGNLFRRRTLDRWAAFFGGLPGLISGSAYRVTHLAHHRYNRGELDPDEFAHLFRSRRLQSAAFWVWAAFGLPIFLVHVAWTGLRRGRSKDRAAILLEYAAILAVHGSLWALLARLGRLDAILWIWVLPLGVTWAVVSLRGWAEHMLTRPEHPLTRTRTITSNRVVSFLMLNLNYHLEHHLFPGVPWYNLPRLHRLLAEEYRAAGAPIYRSYLRFIWDAARRGFHGLAPELSGRRT